MVDRFCGRLADSPVNWTTIPTDGRARRGRLLVRARAEQGLHAREQDRAGRAFLIHCYEMIG